MSDSDDHSGDAEQCPKCDEEMDKLAPAPSDGVDGPERYECLNCPKVWRKNELAESDGGSEDELNQAEITDEFVREHAVPADEAESYVKIDFDSAYHPTGGYWFPAGRKWGDSTGWVSRKYDVPTDELIQYPCEDRDPEIRGRDGLPDWVVNRSIDTPTDRDSADGNGLEDNA